MTHPAIDHLQQVTPQQSAEPLTPEIKAQQVQAMFDRIARTYDLLNDCISFGMHRQWKRQAVQQLHLPQNGQVLDVCTGTGDLVGYLHETLGPEGQVTGLDFSAEMLSLARKRFPESAYGNITFQQGDAMSLPYADNSFDGAIVSFGLRNIVDIPKAIAEMTRVVKPGGWVVNIDTCPKPTLPGYWLYFKTVMPIVGKLFSMDPTAYQYLCESTEKFLTPEQLTNVFQEAGLNRAGHKNLMFASVSMQFGQKPI